MTKKIAAPAVVRASDVLDLVSDNSKPMSLADMTKALNIPKSSLHGICSTLIELNLLSKLDSGYMVLGPHIMQWANAFLSRIDISQEFFASWDDMQVFPEETITLSVMDNKEVTYIAYRNGTRPLGYTFKTGTRLPAVFAATGLAMLSTMTDQKVKSIYKEPDDWPELITSKGIQNIDDLIEELHITRKRYYSFDRECVREGMYCFGAPVFDSNSHEAIAGVAVSILAEETTPDLEQEAGRAISSLAKRLTERLGGLTNTRNNWIYY